MTMPSDAMQSLCPEAHVQDVGEEKIITLKSGLKYADIRVGGGMPPNQGMLVILDYR